jgi:hypothetical protein
MRRLNWTVLCGLGALVALFNVSGCTRVVDHGGGGDHGPYRWEHGDRIDRDGNREAHWCDGHHDDEHCR